MTSFEPIALPPDLGQVLAFPGIYLEPPAGLAVAAAAPRVRRPGRIRRVLALAAVAATAVLALPGCGPAPHHVNLRYNPDGVQMQCTHAELGWTATISGDGRPFTARCDADGPVLYVWDAR